MPDDIITRAEAWQEDPFNGDSGKEIYDGLVAELKTTRAQRDEFAAQLDDALKDWTEDDAQLLAENQRLAAELETARAQLAAVEALAEEWRYKGEFGWGAWQEGHGPDQEGWVLDSVSSRIRAAIERTSQGVADV